MSLPGKPYPSRPPDVSQGPIPETSLDGGRGKILSPLDTIAQARMSIASQLSLDDEILSGLPMTPEMARVCFGDRAESQATAGHGIYSSAPKRSHAAKVLTVDVSAPAGGQPLLPTPLSGATTPAQSASSFELPVPGTPDLTRRSRVSFRDKSRKDKAVMDAAASPAKTRPKPPALQLSTKGPFLAGTRPGLASAVEFSTCGRPGRPANDLLPARSPVLPARSPVFAQAHRAQAQSWDAAAARSSSLHQNDPAALPQPCIVPEPLSRPRTPRTPRSSFSYMGRSVDSPDWSRQSLQERVPPPFDPTSTRDHVAMGVFHVEAGNKDWVLHHWRYAASQSHPVGTLLYSLALREGWGSATGAEAESATKLPECLHIDPLELLALAPPPCLRLARAFERLAKAYQLAGCDDKMLRAYQLAQIVSKLG